MRAQDIVRRGVLVPVRQALCEHRLLLGIIALMVLASTLLEFALGADLPASELWYAPSYRYYIVFIPIPLVFIFLFTRLRTRTPDGRWIAGEEGWRIAWGRFRDGYLLPDRILGALLSGLLVALCINLFGTWKLRIPAIRPFTWDQRFAELDRALHFGRHPWEWLQPVLGHPAVTSAIDWAYYTFTPMIAIVCAWQAWSLRRELRLRFFVTFALVLVVMGDGLATLLSSAGPCYWEELGLGASPYAPLFDYHRRVHELYLFGTTGFQESLWARHQGLLPPTPYTAISAMPSIHVAVTVLYALVGWKTSPVVGLAFAAYACLILLGSVHLGWHYAVDGYVSLLMVPVLWKATGYLPGTLRPTIVVKR